ncbi:MAG: hypothetical protein L6Q92_09045 [Phycisphaerae bacterium]|nr:hypothetical protein [Phycisphaerae bacterium]
MTLHRAQFGSVALAAGLALLSRCAEDARTSRAPEPRSGATTALAEPLPPALAEFRQRLLEADEDRWRMLDMAYLQIAAALAQIRVEGLDYQDFLQQAESRDADIRANGICGLAASRRASAIDHLSRVLKSEPDPYNRTIIVWGLRTFDDKRRVSRCLIDFIDTCRDIDLGRCLGPDGRVQDFSSPFPLAAFEAFKGLVQIEGKAEMLTGGGWTRFVERTRRSVHPEPLTAVDFSRLRGESNPRTDPESRMRRWIEEMREP